MREAAEVANQLMAVERVLQYTQIPPESNLKDTDPVATKIISKDKKEPKKSFADVPENWPNRGCIEFKNVYLSYSDEGPPTVKDLTFTVNPSEKVCHVLYHKFHFK